MSCRYCVVASSRTDRVRWPHAANQLPLPRPTFCRPYHFSFFLMYENLVCRVSWHVSRSVDSTSKSGHLLRAAGGGGAPVAPARRLNRPPPRNACASPIMEILLTHFYMIVRLDGGYPDMGLGETGETWIVEWWCLRFDIMEFGSVWLV